MAGPKIQGGNTFVTRLVCMILLINTIWSSSGYTQGAECLETPITVTKQKLTDYYNYPYERTKIEVDNERNIG